MQLPRSSSSSKNRQLTDPRAAPSIIFEEDELYSRLFPSRRILVFLKPNRGANALMPEAIKPINIEDLKKLVRTVPDFPKPGILFYDITTLLKDKTGFAKLIDALAAHYLECKIDLVLGIEARGFILGAGAAFPLDWGFVAGPTPR